MKKIGIITIVDNNNYGNRLQNYAVKKVFEHLGFSSDTLILNQRKGHLKYLFRAYRMIKSDFLKKYKTNSLMFKRVSRFEKFNDAMQIRILKYPLWSAALLRKRYAFFSVGSDQIWNSNLDYGYGTEFLTFAKPEQRIAFSPSFGGESVRQDKVNDFINGLRGFKYLSVREHSGAELIRKLTGQHAEVIVDPTMMLTREEWEKIEKQPESIDISKPFVLEYFLGKKNQIMEKEISNYARNHKLNRLELLNLNNSDLFCVDPSEFIYLIHHADLVVTDSYHASVFSIIFGRRFAVYHRSGHAEMGSRITTLLHLFGTDSKELEGMNCIFSYEKEKTESILSAERQKGYTYLNKVINQKRE